MNVQLEHRVDPMQQPAITSQDHTTVLAILVTVIHHRFEDVSILMNVLTRQILVFDKQKIVSIRSGHLHVVVKLATPERQIINECATGNICGPEIAILRKMSRTK
jgi:hypothetical protein